jgi:hyperosmotically inducible protein
MVGTMPPGCSFRLRAEVLVLVVLLAGCAARASQPTDDASTTTRVKIALLNDPAVGGLRLDVKTFQGVVTLSGTVKTPAEEQAAVAAARRVKGVRDVKAEMKVEGKS